VHAVIFDFYGTLAESDGTGLRVTDIVNEHGYEVPAEVARRYWQEAGVAHKIDLRLGPALETLRKLLDGGAAGTFDFAFIDADKQNYQGYFDLALQLLRKGGLIVADNVLWSGRVIDPAVNDESTVAIRAFNQRLQSDDRVSITLVPIGDGLFLARKR